jgi:hypothetical protein
VGNKGLSEIGAKLIKCEVKMKNNQENAVKQGIMEGFEVDV